MKASEGMYTYHLIRRRHSFNEQISRRNFYNDHDLGLNELGHRLQGR